MSRRTLDRYSVDTPAAATLDTYYRLYDGATLHTRPEALPPITSHALFHNAQPLMLDVGCGRGEFALRLAQTHPEWNVVGIDMQRKALYDAVHQASNLNLENVYFIKADLRGAMCKIPAGAITAAFLLFPAPVMQRKHRKKDLLTPRFVAALSRALVPQGTLTLVTDHREYFAQKVCLFDQTLTRLKTQEGFAGGITRYQRLWEHHGLLSLRAEYRKGTAE